MPQYILLFGLLIKPLKVQDTRSARFCNKKLRKVVLNNVNQNKVYNLNHYLLDSLPHKSIAVLKACTRYRYPEDKGTYYLKAVRNNYHYLVGKPAAGHDLYSFEGEHMPNHYR